MAWADRGRVECSSGWEGKVAVIPIINVETCFEDEGPCIQPHLGPDSAANWGWRDYGNRCGLERLIKVLDGTPCTAVVNSDLRSDVRVMYLLSNCHTMEIAAHGKANVQNLQLSEDEYIPYVTSCLDGLRLPERDRPSTWLSPNFALTFSDPSDLVEAGVRCLLDTCNDDVCYRLETRKGPLLCCPYSMETNDITLCLTGRATPTAYEDIIVSHVTQLASEAQQHPTKPYVVCLGLHTFIAGVPARAAALASALNRMKNISEVTFMTCSQLCKDVVMEPYTQ